MSHVLPRETAAEAEAGNPRCAVLPVGSFEQHDPFLPLITDTVVASVITGELAQAYGLFALPPVPVSCSHEHHAWRDGERPVVGAGVVRDQYLPTPPRNTLGR